MVFQLESKTLSPLDALDLDKLAAGKNYRHGQFSSTATWIMPVVYFPKVAEAATPVGCGVLATDAAGIT